LSLPLGKPKSANLNLSASDERQILDAAKRLRESGMEVERIIQRLHPHDHPNPPEATPLSNLEERSDSLTGVNSPIPYDLEVSQDSSQISVEDPSNIFDEEPYFGHLESLGFTDDYFPFDWE
jgi:hypothetical protein